MDWLDHFPRLQKLSALSIVFVFTNTLPNVRKISTRKETIGNLKYHINGDVQKIASDTGFFANLSY